MESQWSHAELAFVRKEQRAHKVKGSSPIPQMELQRPDSNGITWLVPEMKEDRTEHELEIRYSRTITENENQKGFARGYVFFSWPSESNTEIYCDSNWKYVFSSSSEPSGVTIVFEQSHGVQGRGRAFKLKSNNNRESEYIDEEDMPLALREVTGDIQMRVVRFSRGMEISSSVWSTS
ncbi:uncharacterized protein LOC129308125 isoform X3 [Prosopis cineraria]|uniref:uncharacterized protein LOC129308125 isoform X3 n=2 Tax=Prosopis cineraria TaxID=364024 RepID=UPI00240F5311|nr:uncharacterized protein LOC129308125 isoform X3 [Prosopis cineraria]